MRKIAILCGLVAAFLCIAQSANAQYARKGANLVDQNKVVLSDQALIMLVGNDIYEQTVIGARKQYKAGNGLIWGGVAGIAAGFVHAVLVTSVPAIHGGFNLYNGGFTAGIVCFIYVPILEHYFKSKSQRKLKA